jgi:butyrate kinase
MERRAGTEERETYLVEHYGPGLTVDVFKQWAGRVRDAANAMEREGKPVRYLRSTIVPTDESLLCLLEARTEELVRETYARAGLPFERLSPVISERERGWAAMDGQSREESR